MMKLYVPKKGFSVLILNLLMVTALPAFAQQDVIKDPSSELARIQKELEQTQPRVQKLQSTTAALNRESNLLQDEIRRSTDRLRDLEGKQDNIEKDITRLREQSSELQDQLDGQKKRLNRVLSAMSRLSMAPKTPLGTTPLSPEATVRTAILLRSLNTQLTRSAGLLQKDLLQIQDSRQDLEKRKIVFAKNELDLRTEKVNLDRLLTERKTAISQNQGKLSEHKTHVQQLRKDAVDIEALIKKLYEEDKKRQKEEKAVALEQVASLNALEKSQKKLENQKKSLSKEDYEKQEKMLQDARLRQIDAMKSLSTGGEMMAGSQFERSKGTLPLPVIGSLEQGSDQFQKGAVIKARTGSVVITPVGGRVIYAGAFRNYGQMVVVSPAENYHILLSGFQMVDATVGQSIQAGDPVGRFDDNTKGNATLYVEIRKNQVAIDPKDWFATIKNIALNTRTNSL